jgi:hypothetical protein
MYIGVTVDMVLIVLLLGGHSKGTLKMECPRLFSASLLFAGPYKEISKDKERVDRKGCGEFPLEKSECAEYQARYDEDYQQYGNRAVHGTSGFDSLNFYISGVL